MANVVEITDSTFESEVAEGVALLDFWAPWCGPCRLQHPILEKVAGAVQDRAKIAKINVDDNQGVAGRFGVQSIPTIVLLKDGEEVNRYVGMTDEKTLVDAVEKAL